MGLSSQGETRMGGWWDKLQLPPIALVVLGATDAPHKWSSPTMISKFPSSSDTISADLSGLPGGLN
jgi:hypothetical protein